MLEGRGLTENDEAVFDALVRRAQATVAELADSCNLSVHHAARILTNLADLGLATRLSGRPARYAAVPPDIGVEALLRQREDDIHDIRAHVEPLMRGFRAGTRFNHPAELIEVVTGRDEVFQRAAKLQQASQSEVRAFDCPPYATRQPYETPNLMEKELLSRGVSCRAVYDRAVLGVDGGLTHIARSMRSGEQARITDDVPLKLAISDEGLAIIPLLRAGDDVVSASYLIYPSPPRRVTEKFWTRPRVITARAAKSIGLPNRRSSRPVSTPTATAGNVNASFGRSGSRVSTPRRVYTGCRTAG